MQNELKKLCYVLLLQFLIVGYVSQTAMAQNITIRGKIPVYIHPDEPAPIRRAVTDLLRDLNTVFGEPSLITSDITATAPVIIVATGDRYKGSQPLISGWEAHQLYADKGSIILNGADMRGTIYAVYTFSELMLGVKPLWFWTSELPARKESVKMAANFRKVISSPYVKYRAWLPNDTDLLSPWEKLSAGNYEAFYETMLRLKLNTLEGAVADIKSFSPPFPAGKSATIAQQRGLAVTGHHLNIFGSSYGNWDTYWKQVRKLPVKAMSQVYRGKFMERLKELLDNRSVVPTPGTDVRALVNALYRKDWVVYAKAPFGGPHAVIEYLGRYTHKVAISNHRITGIDEQDTVSFNYKDYADENRQKQMTLNGQEFIRRFEQHILPKGFTKIRTY